MDEQKEITVLEIIVGLIVLVLVVCFILFFVNGVNQTVSSIKADDLKDKESRINITCVVVEKIDLSSGNTLNLSLKLHDSKSNNYYVVSVPSNEFVYCEIGTVVDLEYSQYSKRIIRYEIQGFLQ